MAITMAYGHWAQCVTAKCCYHSVACLQFTKCMSTSGTRLPDASLGWQMLNKIGITVIYRLDRNRASTLHSVNGPLPPQPPQPLTQFNSTVGEMLRHRHAYHVLSAYLFNLSWVDNGGAEQPQRGGRHSDYDVFWSPPAAVALSRYSLVTNW